MLLVLAWFCVQKPLSQIHRSTSSPLHDAAILIFSVDWGLGVYGAEGSWGQWELEDFHPLAGLVVFRGRPCGSCVNSHSAGWAMCLMSAGFFIGPRFHETVPSEGFAMQESSSRSAEPDRLLIVAGECFMHLLWVETVMRDLMVLREGREDMRRRYSMAFGRESHPSDFSRKRMELGTRDFGFVKEQFLEYWPEWRDDWEVHDAIERVAIWRNALGHANVQPFREFLLNQSQGGMCIYNTSVIGLGFSQKSLGL